VRLAIAEDSTIFRAGVKQVLQEAGHEVIADAGDADGLLASLENDLPDVVLLDLRMPPTYTDEGIAAAIEIRRRHPDVGVLVLSQYAESIFARRLLDTGADGVGYLLKENVANLDALTDAITRVAAGESVVDARLIEGLMEPSAVRNVHRLSKRETEVLRLMAEGRSNAGIARSLALGQKTVEAHLRTIFAKLGISSDADTNSRVSAVLRWLESTRS